TSLLAVRATRRRQREWYSNAHDWPGALRASWRIDAQRRRRVASKCCAYQACGGGTVAGAGALPTGGIMRLSPFFPAAVISIAMLGAAAPVPAHEDSKQSTEKLGKVTFSTSCDPKVQPKFERAVAMLHSFWYRQAREAFEEVLADDGSCAIATWG